MIPIIYHPRCADYRVPGHPERPERVVGSYETLKKLDYKFHNPKPVEIDDILLVHSQDYLERIKNGDFFDLDTPFIPGIFDIACLSAGGAIMASDLLGFSLCRPPGHHATRDKAQGFCYFNNIAIAVMRKVQEGKKVAIIDIDCHHGNGTEEIFIYHDEVIYISLHQSPLYPGTGLSSRNNVFNFPIPPRTHGSQYLETLVRSLEEVAKFNPDLIAVSAGFDTYKGDPLTGLELGAEDYYEIGVRIKSSGIPTFSILEGGYAPDLPLLIKNYLKGLCAD